MAAMDTNNIDYVLAQFITNLVKPFAGKLF
jgi:hypothetical protein